MTLYWYVFNLRTTTVRLIWVLLSSEINIIVNFKISNLKLSPNFLSVILYQSYLSTYYIPNVFYWDQLEFLFLRGFNFNLLKKIHKFRSESFSLFILMFFFIFVKFLENRALKCYCYSWSSWKGSYCNKS